MRIILISANKIRIDWDCFDWWRFGYCPTRLSFTISHENFYCQGRLHFSKMELGAGPVMTHCHNTTESI